MWTLWIVSIVIGLEEPKVTMYGQYKYAWQCEKVWSEITYEFKNGEVAFCTNERHRR